MLDITQVLVVRKNGSKLNIPAHGRSIASDELVRLYKQGYDIEIVDHNTGKDVLLKTMANILNAKGEYYLLQQFLNEMLCSDALTHHMKAV